MGDNNIQEEAVRLKNALEKVSGDNYVRSYKYVK